MHPPVPTVLAFHQRSAMPFYYSGHGAKPPMWSVSMSEIPFQDKRGFFILPQKYEGGGYYTYGTPGRGQGQYAHSRMITMLLSVGHQWSQLDARKFGVGNISLADGTEFKPHRSHRDGLQVDVRALRKDGRETPCSILDSQYDRAATALLIGLFQRHPFVHRILFNDTTIVGVRPARGHNDHFHVELTKGGR